MTKLSSGHHSDRDPGVQSPRSGSTASPAGVGAPDCPTGATIEPNRSSEFDDSTNSLTELTPKAGRVNDGGGDAQSLDPILEAEPELASVLFGGQIDKARRFTSDLALYGEKLGLIGPLEIPRLWSRHIINSVLLAPLLNPGRVGDIGSGAGLPGLVLAIARPDVQMILIEPMERRVDWLRREVSALELGNVEVIRARAEEVQLSPWLDQVTARAVSALSKLIPITVPLVRSGGQLLFLKGAHVQAELDSAAKVLRRLRITDPEILILGQGQVEEVTRVFRATVD